MKLPTFFIYITLSIFLVSCGKDDAQVKAKNELNDVIKGMQIKSDSKSFMGQEIDKPIVGNGDLFYDEDKGCFIKILDGVIAACLLKSKKVYKITVHCLKNKKILSIDGVVCGEKIEAQSSYKKLCSDSTVEDGYYLRKNNAFYWLDHYSQVEKMGIVGDDESLRDEGESPYSSTNCKNAKLLSISNKDDSAKPTSKPYSQVCEVAKGSAITKCLNMQSGMVGMASCDEAVSAANAACKRSDLTILNILEEASKGLSK